MTINAGIEVALARLEAIDPDIHAFVDEPHRRLRLESSAPGEGPLRGVAVGVKDLYRVDGIPTGAGSRLPSSVFAGQESLVVRRLKEAGAVVLGKTAMDEFAYCEPPLTKNPHDPRRTPGGSSGGSAAAVAAGICRVAVGSQTLKSVIVPAAYCGVVGYKTTFGRLSFDGLPLAPSIDSVGFLATSVAEVRKVASVLLPDWDERSSSNPVLGAPEPWGRQPGSADPWRALDKHLDALGSQGFEVRPARVPWNDPAAKREWDHRVGDVLHGEMALAHDEWFDRFAHLYRPRTAEAVRWGRSIDTKRLGECREAASQLAEELQHDAERNGIDCWVCPSAEGIAPIGYMDTGSVSMTALWSYAGFPAISLPAFGGPHRMPLGVQLVTTPGRDEFLLSWAEKVEASLAEADTSDPRT